MENLEKLEEIVKSIYLIEDPGIIKLICATVIANRFNADPVWLFLVAPSGGGKTELITALNDVIGIHPISSLTSKTFISGQKKIGQETSLLFLIQEGIITFKDFTSILSMHPDERREIMGQLREIYDGDYTKRFGTGEQISWKGKIGLIAGVTTTIYLARDMYSAMGERFVMYAMKLPDRKEIARRAMNNVETIKQNRTMVREAFRLFLDEHIGAPTAMPRVNKELAEELLELAEFSTRARSPVERDWHSASKDIVFVHPPEVPTRFSSQLQSLASSLMFLNGTEELTQIDKDILYKIALDSITSTRRLCLQQLTEYRLVQTSALAAKLNYPTGTVRRWLEELNALGMVDRIKKDGGSGSPDKWRIKKHYKPVLERFDHIKITREDLTDSLMEIEENKQTAMLVEEMTDEERMRAAGLGVDLKTEEDIEEPVQVSEEEDEILNEALAL